MARPITLFTGQWADLTLDDLAGKAASFGFDGLELACWGDHFEVDRAVAEPDYAAGRRELLERHGLGCWSIGAHLVGQAVCDPIDARHKGVLPPEVWGDGDPEGVRTRAAERMKDTARAAAAFGVPVVTGFTGSAIWHQLYSFPPNDWAQVRARLRGLRRALGADHRRLRRRGRALRARGPPDGDRLRLRDHAQGAGGHRPPRGLRDQPRPEPLHPAVPRPGRLRDGVRRPHLPRPRQGLAGDARRPALDPRLAHRLRRGRPRLDVRLAGARRRRLRGALPRPEPHRLRRPAVGRVGGLGHGPRVGRGRRASASCARPTSRPRRWPSTRPSRGPNERLPHAGRRPRRGRRADHRRRDARLRVHGQGARQRLSQAVLHDLAAAAHARPRGDRRAQRGGGGRGRAPLRLRGPRDRLARAARRRAHRPVRQLAGPTTSTPSRRSPPRRRASTSSARSRWGATPTRATRPGSACRPPASSTCAPSTTASSRPSAWPASSSRPARSGEIHHFRGSLPAGLGHRRPRRSGASTRTPRARARSATSART